MKIYRDLALTALLILALSSFMESCSGGGGGGGDSTVPSVTDTTAPTVPSGITTTVTSTNEVSIAWSVSLDAGGVAGYKIYRDGTYLKSVATISTLDSNLTASTQYCYQVSAYDAAGNESAKCSQMCAITLAWPNEPTRICNASGNQNGVRLIEVIDGYIVAWQDERRGGYRDIYVQKFDVDGSMKWANNGRVIAAGNNGEASNNLLYNSQSLSGLVSDTQGGAIVLWTEDYSCSSGPCGNGWITRINSNSNVQWGASPSPGIAIQGTDTAVSLVSPGQHVHADAIAPDGEGGAFVIQDYDAWGNWNVFRLNSNGAFRSITSTTIGARGASHMIYGGNSNGKDYVSIAWWDYGDFAINIEDPEVNYPASTDTLSASWNAITLTNSPSWWSEPSIISDGAGGMIIVWEDGRNGNFDLYAQRISASGSVQWVGGVPISVQPGDQRNPQLVSDGAGGAVIVWQDSRTSPTRIYAQHVQANGNISWTAGGIPVSSIYGESPKVIGSNDNAVIVVWIDSDHNGGTKDYLRAQKIDIMTGNLLWTPDSRTQSGGTTGTVISEIYGPYFDIASDGSSGLIAVWELGGDIYMRRVMSDGDFI